MTTRPSFRPLAILILVAVASLATAAGKEPSLLSIRLVRAGQGDGIDPQLQDVAALMRGTMAFSSFKLLDSKTVSLPASEPVLFAGNYKMTLKGAAEDLDIGVTKGRNFLLKTRVKLRGKAPLVLGGIATRDGTLLFVLTPQ